MPRSWTDLEAQLEDEIVFFVLAARQALKASWVLEQRGEQMPQFRQQEELRAWRDHIEHWDAPARGRPDRSGDDWRSVSDEVEPGLSRSGYGHRLTNVSGVSLKKLKKDLKRAKKAALAVSDREWLYCYITADEAAEILEMSTEAFLDIQPRPPGRFDFGDDPPYDGVRYFREWVEARRDRLMYPPGWEETLGITVLSD